MEFSIRRSRSLVQPIPEMKQAVVEGELIGDVALKIHRAVNGAAHGKEQVMVVGEVNDGADIEGGAGVRKVGLRRSLMIYFRADGNIVCHLLLEYTADKAPVVMAIQ